MIFQLSTLARQLYDLVERQGSLDLTSSPAPDSGSLAGSVVTTPSPPRLDPKLLELARVENYIGKTGKGIKISLYYLFV